MGDEDKYRGVPQSALHLDEKSARRQKEQASRTGDEDLTDEGSAKRESKQSTDSEKRPAKDEKDQAGSNRRDKFEQRSEGTERGGTGPNETLNKV